MTQLSPRNSRCRMPNCYSACGQWSRTSKLPASRTTPSSAFAAATTPNTCCCALPRFISAQRRFQSLCTTQSRRRYRWLSAAAPRMFSMERRQIRHPPKALQQQRQLPRRASCSRPRAQPANRSWCCTTTLTSLHKLIGISLHRRSALRAWHQWNTTLPGVTACTVSPPGRPTCFSTRRIRRWLTSACLWTLTFCMFRPSRHRNYWHYPTSASGRVFA